MSKRILNAIRDTWPAKLDEEVRKRFWLTVKTEWDVTAGSTGAYVTKTVNGEPIPPDALAFINGYSSATSHAMLQVRL